MSETETPAALLRRAAEHLRNPFALPGLTIGIDPDLGVPLAGWLEATADGLASTHPDWQERVEPDALAVARAVLGEVASCG